MASYQLSNGDSVSLSTLDGRHLSIDKDGIEVDDKDLYLIEACENHPSLKKGKAKAEATPKVKGEDN